MITRKLTPWAITATMAALLPLSSNAATAATVVVSPDKPNGWTDITQRTATGEFEEGPLVPPAGTGSYEMTTGAGGSGPSLPQGGSGQGGKVWLSTGLYNGTALAAITELGYSTYIEPASPTPGHIAPSLQLQVDLDGNGTRDTTMVYEPVYNGTVVKGVWQPWDAAQGDWWFTRAFGSIAAGATAANMKTIAEVVALYPNAQIVRWYGAGAADGEGMQLVGGMNSAGAPWSNFVGNVDAVKFNGTLFDFEADGDGDGVPDVDDENDNSDTRPFVDVNGNEPGETSIPNETGDDGVTLQDIVNGSGDTAKNHGQYVSSIAKLADDLYRSGAITKSQRQELKTSAAQSNVGK